jgi:hypothetical protein
VTPTNSSVAYFSKSAKSIALFACQFLAVQKIPMHHQKFANRENATQKSDYCPVVSALMQQSTLSLFSSAVACCSLACQQQRHSNHDGGSAHGKSSGRGAGRNAQSNR